MSKYDIIDKETAYELLKIFYLKSVGKTGEEDSIKGKIRKLGLLIDVNMKMRQEEREKRLFRKEYDEEYAKKKTNPRDLIHSFIELNGYRLGFYQITDLLSERQLSHEISVTSSPKASKSVSFGEAPRKLQLSPGDQGTKMKNIRMNSREFDENPCTPSSESKRRHVRFAETEKHFGQVSFLAEHRRSISADENLGRDDGVLGQPVVRNFGPFSRKPKSFFEEFVQKQKSSLGHQRIVSLLEDIVVEEDEVTPLSLVRAKQYRSQKRLPTRIGKKSHLKLFLEEES